MWKCHTSVSVRMKMKLVLNLRADVDMTEPIRMRPRLVCMGESCYQLVPLHLFLPV